MYLEERVQQLEILSVDQGKQIEIIAKGLAIITTDMQKGFADVRQQQNKMFKELNGVKNDVSTLKTDVSVLKTDMSVLKTEFASLNTNFTTFRAEVDEKFDRMDKRFDDIITLIKSK